MRNTKEIKPILTAIYCLNRAGEKDKNKDMNIELICDYAFRRLFGANTNLLALACIGQTKESIEQQVTELLEMETDYKKYLEEYKK